MSESSADTEEATECPTCGRDDFASNQGMKTHHKQMHGESIAQVDAECHHCGDSLTLPKWKAKRADRHFCDDGCRGDWMSETRSGEDHPRWLGDEAINECEWCGDEFRKLESQSSSTPRFCSFGCYSEWKEDAGREEHTCEQCGSTFTTQKAEDHQGRFCSYDCLWRWRSENWSGENNPRWRGGYTERRGTNWPKLRAQALAANDHRCQGCGISEDDHREEHGVGLDVHHIRPVTEFDEPSDADTVDNLVPLCRDCHTEWEGIPLRPTAE